MQVLIQKIDTDCEAELAVTLSAKFGCNLGDLLQQIKH